MGTPLPRLSVTLIMMMMKMTMMAKLRTYDINNDSDDCDTGNLSSCDLISKVWVYKKQPNEATQMKKSGHTDHQM